MTALLAASDAASRTASTASSAIPARRATSVTARLSSPTPGGVPGNVTSISGPVINICTPDVPRIYVANRPTGTERARPDKQDGPFGSIRCSDERDQLHFPVVVAVDEVPSVNVKSDLKFKAFFVQPARPTYGRFFEPVPFTEV